MDSPASVSGYVPRNSKKRIFLAGSSSSACKEVEVLEISPPSNRPPKPTLSKQNEVVITEVIDVDTDMEDECDMVLTDGEVDPSVKGKEVFLNSSVALGSFTDGIVVSNNGSAGLQDPTNVDEFNNNLFYGEDEWIDTYYEDILFDDYSVLESHFDHMDIPPGVEAPFPWLPSSPGNNSKLPSSGTSSHSKLHFQPDGAGLSPGLNSSQPSFPLFHTQIGNQSTSWGNLTTDIQMNASRHKKEKLSSKRADHVLGKKKATTSSGTSNISLQHPVDALAHKFGKELAKSKRKPRLNYPNHYNQFPSPSITNAPAGGSYMSAWQDFPLGMFEPSLTPGFSHGNAFTSWQDPASNQNDTSAMETASSTQVGQRNMDEILQKFDQFKKFDTVEDFSDHRHYRNSLAKQPSKNWTKRILDEWKILEKDLPDEIFVRVCESRMDLLRAVIVGAEGTPYHDGLFFFDIFFPGSYPNVPPHVHYHSGGLRINPNLYDCGKVCLSLLNTWNGSQKEKWIPGDSTMLQVLVSIQGLILNAKPYFNEPGYANLSGSPSGEKRSLEYNEKIFIFSLQTMVYSMKRPPKYFEDFVSGHFCKHARDILVSCKAYLEGAQVGCLVKGGVQDVDEGDKSCSQQFKTNLSRFIVSLVNTFSQIGAKDCHEFLPLASSNGSVTTGPRPLRIN